MVLRLRPLRMVKLPEAVLLAKFARASTPTPDMLPNKLELPPSRTMVAALLTILAPSSLMVLFSNTCQVPSVRVSGETLVTTLPEPPINSTAPLMASAVPSLVNTSGLIVRLPVPSAVILPWFTTVPSPLTNKPLVIRALELLKFT